MALGPATIESLQRHLNHCFADPALLARALTHRSHSSLNNERLEFLGDSALGLAAADALYHRFPDADEGQLSRLKARLVRQPTLAEIARELQLGEALALGEGALKGGAFNQDSVLADALEAVLGAVLLDAGYAATAKVIHSLLQSRLEGIQPDEDYKDAKTRLQEHLHSIAQALPEYALVKASGKPPKEEFEVECRLAALDRGFHAKGPSRRLAEQAAASLALQALGVAV